MNCNDESLPHNSDDLSKARDLARRYQCELVDLANFPFQLEVLRSVSVELMRRLNFVPLEQTVDGRLAIAVADPSHLLLIDQISLLLNQSVITRISTIKQITETIRRIADRAIGIGGSSADTSPASDGESDPRAPVPIKPKQNPRSGGAMAVPDQQ